MRVYMIKLTYVRILIGSHLLSIGGLWWPRTATQNFTIFKDLIKNKRKNKLKLKVKWNVTAKQRKKND